MRYFVLSFIIACVLAVAVLGFRGKTSRKPPVELFSDMDRQPKIRPQEPSRFFADGMASRPPMEGTVSRGAHFLDVPVNTGMETGTTNFVTVSPLPITNELMARGQERYNINCSPCHSKVGDGNGITKKFGMAVVTSLHDPRLIQMTDGELFYVITHGRNLMGPYGPNTTPEDRWAIIAYVRALQLARLGNAQDFAGQSAALVK